MAFTRVLSLNLYLVQTYIQCTVQSPGKKAVNYTDAPSRHFKKFLNCARWSCSNQKWVFWLIIGHKRFAQPYSPTANKAATAAYSWVTNLIQSTLCYQSNK